MVLLFVLLLFVTFAFAHSAFVMFTPVFSNITAESTDYEPNQTFFYNILFENNTASANNINISCTGDICEVSSDISPVSIIVLVKDSFNNSVRYVTELKFTNASYDYYMFYFQYYSDTSNTTYFGDHAMVYLSGYTVSNDIFCFIGFVIAIILVYLGYKFYKNNITAKHKITKKRKDKIKPKK
jgi:hypothetical protein